MQYLTDDDVMLIRKRLSSLSTGEDIGSEMPRDANLLASAIYRQHVGFGGVAKHDKPFQVAGTLFYGLALNHAFENGNKRTALVALLACLQKNKWVLSDASEDDLYEFCTGLAGHELAAPPGSDEELALVLDWVRVRSRPLVLGDKRMNFKEFRRLLEAQGCTFDRPRKNYIKVHREAPVGHRSYRMGYPRRNFPVDVPIIKDVRAALELNEVAGVDSMAFYDFEQAVDEFVNTYRLLLDRLAET